MKSILTRPHIHKGRTLQEAYASLNYYRLSNKELGITLDYPSSTSPEETIELAMLKPWQTERLQAGTVLSVDLYLPGSKIGCSFIWHCGSFVIGEGRVDWKEYP